MTAFAGWGLTLLGLAIVTTVAEMLLPHGKTKSAVRYVVAVVAALVIITPIPSMLRHGINFDFDFDTGSVTDSEYLDYVDGLKEKLIENAVVRYVESKGVNGLIVTVELDDLFNVKSASIDFSKTVMTGNGEHINKSEIIRLVADYLRIGEEAIMTYG